MVQEEEIYFNPIDPKKVALNPGTLPYAHHAGSAIIKPLDKGKIKGNAMAAMYEQTDRQLDQIREQVDLLVKQAQQIKDRMLYSEWIYKAECGFKPLIGHIYHLYQKPNDSYFLSMVGPKDWGRSSKFEFVVTAKLLSDHTWDILEGKIEMDKINI
jgi:hypothetical protein